MTELTAAVLNDFGRAVREGLNRDRKAIPPRYFYDLRGSQLFEQITALPEYYPTRTETALLHDHAEALGRLAGRGRPVVEFGAGSAMKTPLLLAATGAATYVPLDISGEFLAQTVANLGRSHPALNIIPIVGDFSEQMDLPALPRPLTGFFPGSTIGNCDPRSAVDLLRSFRETLGEDARLVIGIDTRKNARLLEAAYDDAAGVTAAFNLNLLDRINRELGGTIPVDAFEHRAVWNENHGRIEMHLVAARALDFRAAGQRFSMVRGETIHTENSYKYSMPEARLLARASGWEPLAFWSDPDDLFGLHVWAANREGIRP